jgi:hypothetical protein
MVRRKLPGAAAVGFALALGASGCAHSRAAGPARASPLAVVSAPTPRFPVALFGTGGTYPRVRDGKLKLSAVDRTLRQAIVADQRAFEPYARRYATGVAGRRLRSGYAGYYETELDRTLVSASTVVVSVLIPRTRAVLPFPPRADGWLGITIRVPSGTRVTLPELFAQRAKAMRVLEARIRTDARLARSVRRHPAAALANVQLALLPSGLAVGVVEVGFRDVVLVPYSALRPYLSRRGFRLVAGTRWPDFRPDHAHLSYCRRPDTRGPSSPRRVTFPARLREQPSRRSSRSDAAGAIAASRSGSPASPSGTGDTTGRSSNPARDLPRRQAPDRHGRGVGMRVHLIRPLLCRR